MEYPVPGGVNLALNPLSSQIASLQSERDALTAQISTLQSTMTDWEAKHASVVTERDALATQATEKDGHIKEVSEKVNDRQ